MQRVTGSGGALALLLVLVAGACSNGAQPSSTPSDAPATASPDAATASPSADPSPAATPGASPLPGAVLVPGTHAALVPPEGFTASATFVGFEHESGASIVIAELPGPYGEIVPGLTDEGFAGQGISVTARTELTVNGLPGLLVEGTQSAAGGRFGKVILVTGVAALTVMVNGNYPIDETAIGAAIREAALTISVDPERSTDPAAVLTFTVDPAPPLRFAGAFVNAGAYNTSGAFPSADIDEPFFIVAPSLGVAAPGDLEGFAVQRLQETATVRDVEIESTKEITIAGRPGIEIVATAVRASRPGEVVVYQVLLGGDEDYVVMSGICAADRAEECLAAFAATAATFEPLP